MCWIDTRCADFSFCTNQRAYPKVCLTDISLLYMHAIDQRAFAFDEPFQVQVQGLWYWSPNAFPVLLCSMCVRLLAMVTWRLSCSTTASPFDDATTPILRDLLHFSQCLFVAGNTPADPLSTRLTSTMWIDIPRSQVSKRCSGDTDFTNQRLSLLAVESCRSERGDKTTALRCSSTANIRQQIGRNEIDPATTPRHHARERFHPPL